MQPKGHHLAQRNVGRLVAGPGGPRFIARLTVWESAAALKDFVFNTVRRRFHECRSAWFEMPETRHFEIWRAPEGRRRGLDEALERLATLRTAGESDQALGWSWLTEARGPAPRRCNPVAAE